ncbi:Tol biopolymer transporter periplasmic protein [Synechococcus sp. Cruz-9H2]|uniref:Tol biopolymer transporter periplasmic protein n=1 Tax=Synechococcus sp. Cruz-9H2 TaxID=2823732 RepID=UPI0020CE45B6|nr:Tol biopolymer transporter periplasmic protein [Synechococcus sp. Cruz-9H2]
MSAALATFLGSCSLPWSGRSRPAPSPGWQSNLSRQDPALSGDGRLLASVIERQGRSTVLLQERISGRVLPLRHLSRWQPHSSPSLSWRGRYLALIVQRGDRRLAVIEDRLTNRLVPLPLPGGLEPVKLSLAPDGQRLALQLVAAGRWQVELFDLGGVLEIDPPAGEVLRTPALAAP